MVKLHHLLALVSWAIVFWKGKIMTLVNRIALLILFTVVSYTGSAQVPASGDSQSQAGLLEEIVVTSRKREESLLDIPVAVTAFTA
jgi:hypothetical protein